MNRFNGIGRWAKSVELRYTPNGTAVANSTIAINEGYGDKKTTTFLPVVIWGKTAEIAAQYTDKGSQVGIEGRIQVRNWDKDGQKHYVTEIVAERVELLGGNKNADTGHPGTSSDPFANDSKMINISDEDLPF